VPKVEVGVKMETVHQRFRWDYCWLLIRLMQPICRLGLNNEKVPLSTTAKLVPSHSASQLNILLDRASSLHASELSIFTARPNSTGSSASDQAFLRNILASGSLSDRLSMFALMAQCTFA
jgi:hypothetical protein